MKPFFLRSLFLLCAATIQVSFARAIFPAFPIALPVLFSVAVSLTLLKGFTFSWVWAVVGGIFADAMLLGRIGESSLELILAAAAFSLTAKELLFRYRLERILLFGAAVWLFQVFLRFVEVLFISSTGFWGAMSALFSFACIHWASVAWSFIFSIILFALIFPLVLAIERSIELFERTRVGR